MDKITAMDICEALHDSAVDICACGLEDDGKTAGLDGRFDLEAAAEILNHKFVPQ